MSLFGSCMLLSDNGNFLLNDSSFILKISAEWIQLFSVPLLLDIKLTTPSPCHILASQLTRLKKWLPTERVWCWLTEAG